MTDNKDLHNRIRSRQQRHDREKKLARKISNTILLAILGILACVIVFFYVDISGKLQPYNPNDTNKVEVTVQPGTTMNGLAAQLEELKLIKSATLFNVYLKTKDVGVLQAGNYALSPSMTLDEILETLKAGGTTERAVVATVLVREGDNITQISDSVAKTTPFTKEEFLTAVQDETFIQSMISKYPDLLMSMSEKTDLMYKLEGYLFPATYDYHEADTVQMLIESMIKKSHSVLAAYYNKIKEKGLTVHEMLTIASLTEKEGVKTEDRKKIVSVFENRIVQNMPLQSDVSVLYALGTHKELVTYADLEVDSPYNLYKHVGYGPGPFASSSEDAIQATLDPVKTDFLYFVADIDTGIVYYSRTLDEHNKLVEQYVNN